MKPVELAALAEDDLREARAWYDERSPGRGEELIRAVDKALLDIAESPLRFAVLHRDIRRAFVRPFPYGVFFRDLPSRVRVIAIVHLSRHPRTWRRRS